MAARRRPASRGRSPRAGRVARRTPVDRLRAICLALPETTEKIAWSEPTWRVRGKLFAQLDNHHHGADHLAVWPPAPPGAQEALVFTAPVRLLPPPQVGPGGWVGGRAGGRPKGAGGGREVRGENGPVPPRPGRA